MVREFSLYKAVVDHYRGSTKTVQKNWGRRLVADFFFAKSARCFAPVIEIKPNTLVFNETSTQAYSLSEEGFGYNYGRFKTSANHTCR